MVYTLEEVAELLKVSVQTVRKLIKEKRLRAVRIGVQLRVRKEDLDRFLESDAQ